MNIQHIAHQDINRRRWNKIVRSSGHGRIYYCAEYLDVACPCWDALVLDDYKIIMPLPNKNNWLLQRIHYIPLYVQQLGILGSIAIDNDIIIAFIYKANSLYRKFIHPFNHENGIIQLESFPAIQRVNFELSLNTSYGNIQDGYRDSLKRNLIKCESDILEFRTETNFSVLENFILKYSNPKDPSPKHIDTIKALSELKSPFLDSQIYSVWKKDKPLAVCLAPKYQNRITLLLPRSSSSGRSMNAMAFLIDRIIRQYANQDIVIDFEGSMLPGVSNFYKGFGAIDRPYYLVSKA